MAGPSTIWPAIEKWMTDWVLHHVGQLRAGEGKIRRRRCGNTRRGFTTYTSRIWKAIEVKSKVTEVGRGVLNIRAMLQAPT